MKEKRIFISIGILIYVAMSVINRFIYQIPDILYIILGLTSIFLIIYGYIKGNKKHKNNSKN